MCTGYHVQCTSQSSFLPAEFKLLVQIVSGSHELFHGTILVSFPEDYRANMCVCVDEH